MDGNSFEVFSDCSSEGSETPSEREARIYSIVHYNDFSGTTGSPLDIDPKYGVEFNCNGEVIVFLKDIDNTVKDTEVCEKYVIPTITLDDDDMESPKEETSVIDTEFAETSLKKKRKKKKKNVNGESIEEYINHVKQTNALEEYKEKSGLNKVKPKSSKTDKVSLNVAFCNERAMPMTPSEVLKQYHIGKRTECSLWYRCPKTWTPDMVKYYTKIQKSHRNFDCAEELRKIKETYGSSPDDWILNPIELYKSYSNTPRVKCHICRQYGHTGYYCQEQYKPEVCIMCGMQGHNFHNCDKKLCFSCGKIQKRFTNNCYNCISMSRVTCKLCNTVGHESKHCTESWRQFHNIISTEPEVEDYIFAQSTSRSKNKEKKSNKMKSDTSSFIDIGESSKASSRNEKSNKSIDKKTAKRLKRLRAKKKHSKNKNNLSVANDKDNDSINIDVNIQDVTLKRTLTKKSFLKNKKIKC